MQNRKIFLLEFALFLILIFISPLKSQAQVDPAIEWKKMSLPHFELIYDARHQELANIYAARLELAAQKLKPQFQILPEKTAVVIDDRTDLTNGSATAFPYPVIFVYPVLPGPQESIGEFGDWASELITHEYTHILAMYQRRDLVDKLSSVFGSIMIPNLLLPRWWHEGAAVEMETRYSNAGRLRSPQQDSWIRSYFDTDSNSGINWESVRMGDANEVSIPTWPYGARPYLMGSLIWSEILNDKPQALKDLSWAHGGRAPYIINYPAENILGVEYPEYFRKTKSSVALRVQKQFEILQKVAITKFIPLGLEDVESFSPAISPDGLKIAFIGKDETLRRSIQILERPSRTVVFDATHLKKSANARMTESSEEMKAPIPRMREEDGPPGGVISRLEWFPNSKKIIFDKLEEESWFHDISDLYSYDLETSKTDRLTYGLRAREATISPDGKQVAFIKVVPGKTDLQLFNLETKKAQELFTAPMQTRCSHPTFINDHEIIFSFRENGHELLTKINLRNPQKIQKILTNFTQAYFPEFKEGKLVFISTANGVPNLYLADSSLNTATPLTHTLTGISQSTLDVGNNDAYITQQTTSGLRLVRISKQKNSALPVQLPKVEPLFADRYPANSVTQNILTNQESAVEEYSSLSYLLPKYWFPFVGWDSRSTYFTVLTSSSDPLSKHTWSFYGMYNFTDQRLGYTATYLNTTTSAQILTLASDITYTMPTSTQISQLGHIEALWQLLLLSPQWQGSLGWSWARKDVSNATSISEQSGPSLSLNYYDYKKSGIQISPESGLGGSLTATYFQTADKLQPSFNQFEGSIVKYWSKWLPTRHALMTRFQSFFIDQPTSSTNYAFTQSQPPSANSPLPQYLARAYPTGEFMGKSLHQATFEYRFPIKNLFLGWNTKAFYFKQLHGALIADGVVVNGFAYDLKTKKYNNVDGSQNFWSMGAEAHISTTIGYHFPMEFYVGIYAPTDTQLNATPLYSMGFFL